VCSSDLYCVNADAVPGFQRIELDYGQTSYWQTSITCPQGKRILNGGTQSHFGTGLTYASYPSIVSWTATGYQSSGHSTYLRAWCVDAGTPTAQLTYASPGSEGTVTASPYASFAFTGRDPAGYPNTFKCSLDGSAPVTCTSASYGPLASGSHEFAVTNTTPDGRLSAPATFHWTVDTVPPNVSMRRLPPVTLPASTTVRWTGSDSLSGVDHYEAAYRLVHAGDTTGTWTYPGAWSNIGSTSVQTPNLAEGDSICVAVRAYDEVGNVSPWTAPACTSRPLDDRALTASTGWTRATGASDWMQTVTTTTLLDKTLKRDGVHLSRVGVVATVCPGCGAVTLKVGTTTIGSIDLTAAATQHKQVLLLPRFAPQTGTVTVKSSSSGKTIAIDGLVVIQKVSQGPG